MSREIIRLSNLSKKYSGTSRDIHVIKNINLKVQTGKLIALIGPSGSGKSTLLHLMGLLDKPTSGEVFFKGKSLSKSSEFYKDESRKKNISIIYQQSNLLNDFNALENVIIPLIINGEDWKDSENKARKMLSYVNLTRRFHHFPSELSGGEQQRVAIARALITSPDLILADEPTGSLDRRTAQEVFSLFLKFKSKNRTIIYATHNRELASKADYKLSLIDGNIKRINE